MVVSVDRISSLNWSPKLGEFGEIVENIADIDQCITIILTTPKGSDPHRPTFASNIHSFIDHPQTLVKQFLIRETYEALLTWEPRIDVENVKIYFDPLNLGRVSIEIKWTLKLSTIEQITVVVI